jgi:hypothetical protein
MSRTSEREGACPPARGPVEHRNRAGPASILRPNRRGSRPLIAGGVERCFIVFRSKMSE